MLREQIDPLVSFCPGCGPVHNVRIYLVMSGHIRIWIISGYYPCVSVHSIECIIFAYREPSGVVYEV